MNFKSLCQKISDDSNIPLKEVRTVSGAILQEFAQLIESQDSFISPYITFKSITKNSTDDSEEQPVKFAKMHIRQSKSED